MHLSIFPFFMLLKQGKTGTFFRKTAQQGRRVDSDGKIKEESLRCKYFRPLLSHFERVQFEVLLKNRGCRCQRGTPFACSHVSQSMHVQSWRPEMVNFSWTLEWILRSASRPREGLCPLRFPAAVAEHYALLFPFTSWQSSRGLMIVALI